jgi:hypothetical protein
VVQAARELRDRYIEQINAGLLLPPSANGKYDVSRQLAAPSNQFVLQFQPFYFRSLTEIVVLTAAVPNVKVLSNLLKWTQGSQEFPKARRFDANPLKRQSRARRKQVGLRRHVKRASESGKRKASSIQSPGGRYRLL